MSEPRVSDERLAQFIKNDGLDTEPAWATLTDLMLDLRDCRRERDELRAALAKARAEVEARELDVLDHVSSKNAALARAERAEAVVTELANHPLIAQLRRQTDESVDV